MPSASELIYKVSVNGEMYQNEGVCCKRYPEWGIISITSVSEVCLYRCTTHFGVVFCGCILSTGGARLTASLTRGYRGVTPVGVTTTSRADVSLRLLTSAYIFG